ncbi:MAG: Hydroxypyruvate reductase [Alphaproteobacteria bacterium MarineAlpha11_Bin1]|nr:MAG: Hydroxypyruvate reductase [Alphaproteobacteria bacterium MarineAlpha11_Bin1]|tara:strand:- start:177 stop:1163 length:987 start_codon:yes stop_codon:yes gene_type:complete
MIKPLVLVSHLPPDDICDALIECFGEEAEVAFLPNLKGSTRERALRSARIVMTYHPIRDLGLDGLSLLSNCELIQCLTAGIDYLPLSQIPDHIPVAYNAGAYAEPMAEHVVAMALAASKRLSVEHRNMTMGEFNQFVPTKKIDGATCGILGFGVTGREVARVMRGLGMRIEAVNRSGNTDEQVGFIGTLDDLDSLMSAADIFVITVPLTRNTDRLIRAQHLALMKPDAVLVNVARGEIIVEDDLYRHLLKNPRFTACLEAWWIEPVRHGKFETSYPFLDLPNVIASPHNSAMTEDALTVAAQRGAENVLRLLRGFGARYIAGEDMRML